MRERKSKNQDTSCFRKIYFTLRSLTNYLFNLSNCGCLFKLRVRLRVSRASCSWEYFRVVCPFENNCGKFYSQVGNRKLACLLACGALRTISIWESFDSHSPSDLHHDCLFLVIQSLFIHTHAYARTYGIYIIHYTSNLNLFAFIRKYSQNFDTILNFASNSPREIDYRVHSRATRDTPTLR